MIPNEAVNYLTQLRQDLQTFNPDQIEMVNEYLPKTSLRTELVGILGKVRIYLIEQSDENLTRTFTAMKTDFISYIDKRISRLQNPLTGEQNDPWIALERGSRDPDLKKNCSEASAHINDLLFGCDQVARHKLEAGCQIEAEEVNKFRTAFLPGYLNSITALSDETKQKLNSGFTELEKSFRERKYDQAEKTSGQIRATLSASVGYIHDKMK